MAWYVDKGLLKLAEQTRERYIGITIYFIGDEKHQGGVSDHNPEADGSVDAGDFMLGKSFTENEAYYFVNELTTSRDKRIKYIIWSRRIWKPSTGWKAYNGDDPHTNHVHVSVNDNYENDTTEWEIFMPTAKEIAAEVIKQLYNVKIEVDPHIEDKDPNKLDPQPMLKSIGYQDERGKYILKNTQTIIEKLDKLIP